MINYSETYLENYKQRSIYDSNCIEFWTPITERSMPGVYPGRYMISSFGRTWNNNTNRPIALSMHKKGYYQLNISSIIPNKKVCRKLHRVLMLEFCYFPGCEIYEVNHKDGNKLNNNIINLEWATHSENTIHAINMGLKKVFNNEVSVILSDDEVASIIYMYETLNMTAHEICNKLNKEGLSYVLVENICVGACRKSYRNNLYNHY